MSTNMHENSSINDDDEVFSIGLKVRDYECDMQGIVNNTVYMHYLEHARHEYLSEIGLNWKDLISKGIYLVATNAEVKYKKMLTPGELFTVTCIMLPDSKFKVRFVQQILNENEALVLEGSVTAAFLDKAKKPILVNEVTSDLSPV